MALDPYSACPGGTGKKLKFCCPDLVHELQKLERLTEAQQFQACLSEVERLLAKHPGRACLLNMQGELLEVLGRHEESEHAYEELAVAQPDNPVALAKRAEGLAARGELREAIELVQQALVRGENQIPRAVPDALEVITTVLAQRGDLIAAIAHTELYLAMLPDEQEMQMALARLEAAPAPLLLKEQRSLEPLDDLKSPAAAEALELAHRGAWAQAADKLASLTKKHKEHPGLWRNLATLRSWLRDNDAAAEAWRQLAALDLPGDDAVEAEALAQLLDRLPEGDMIALVAIEQTVHDLDQLLQNLSADARFNAITVERRAGDQPPPQAAFQILDRALPAEGATLELGDIPQIIGQLELYGKETDRDARIILLAAQDERLDQARDILGEHGFGLLGPASEPRVLNPAYTHKGSQAVQWRLPDDTPPEKVAQLSAAHREQAYLQTWPKTPAQVLGGKTPAQAVSDPRWKRAVAAQILLHDLMTEADGEPFDFDRLRSQLGLPVAPSIEAASVDVDRLPLARLHRVDVQQLTDHQLEHLFSTAARFRADRALRKAADEILARESLRTAEAGPRACLVLSGLARQPQEALQWIDRGRELDEARGKSSAPWDLRELRLRIVMGQPEEFQRVLDHLAREHFREPGVREAVMSFLMQIGVMTPDGRVRGPQVAPSPETASGLVLPESPAASGEIWTPDSERAASGKPALWTPDSD
ncbi:MAG: hypothetical protein K1X74_02330 [Pirellulales bacterium]|nr:hypothetical protein [Pirellulales bacterium]